MHRTVALVMAALTVPLGGCLTTPVEPATVWPDGLVLDVVLWQDRGLGSFPNLSARLDLSDRTSAPIDAEVRALLVEAQGDSWRAVPRQEVDNGPWIARNGPVWPERTEATVSVTLASGENQTFTITLNSLVRTTY